ncbi:High affinity cAMP-specific 3',5'-cyclic phosphodiesterase 7A [Schistosoma haematobium]|uniref:High affinity cAMP-specific 3',5'-cyclic phosphodiesterase 7A n=2 Tax=Schistosoma haematobium TaxID=6185 RepID=A0A922S373_SCHHA|nr:High affinity cAMP-specific 3',5'-cyclic phosphodiesterase 7A [Schistosoma haematobium]KAH9591607.1 High affinity cAMP-specific 3',5'-cyclic phosphodiesterase 7A [Schistosoma haematobium]CAH8676302.1 unnamed protein product [Schistosoma haematobium]
MRRSRTDQKSGSWSHMEIDLTNKNLQRTKNSSRRRIRYRSNSFNSFACQQSEQMAGTIQLFYLYEDKNSKNMYNLDNSKEDVKKSQTAERMVDKIHLSFIDHPVGHVKIKNLNNWDLNIFHLKRITSNYTIRDIGLQIMNEYDLFHKLKLDYFMMARIFSSIEAAYHNFNPYHTALHAADVLQAMHCFISQSQLLTILSPTEIFASLLATALHDADHPGVNQSYLEKTGDFLVDLYKSVSVLEKHHAKFGLCILQENGLSNALELKDWEFVRDCFLKLIPATDITYQGVYQKQFKDLTNYHMANPSLSYTISDRLLIMQMALKCSDISNPCRVWPICKEWAIRVCCELFCQGDRERFQWSLQPIPTMDRTKFTLARIQIGFIRDMVKPLLTGWHEFFQNNLTLKILQNLDENLKNWLTDLSSSSSSSSGITTYVNRHNSLDSQLTSTLPLSYNNNQSISTIHYLDQIKQKTIKSEKLDQKNKIDLQKPFIGSIHLTNSPIQEIDTVNTCESFDSNSNNNNNNLHSGKSHQTIFITTRVIRRHSLPETQLAIRKTFNFSLSNKSSTVVLLKNDTQNMLSFHSRNNHINIPISKIKSQSSTIKSPSSSTCTVSANILHMLYEELKNNKPNYLSSKIDLKSIPNTIRCKDNKLLEQKVLDLNYDRTVLRFSALAHRRSSAPITEH